MPFRINIHISGTYVRLAGVGRSEPIAIAAVVATAPSPSLSERHFKLEGTLEARGLADGVPITGTVRLLDWRRPRLEYSATFTNDRGDPYQLRGHRPLGPRLLLHPGLTMDADITEPQGTLVARCHLHARWRPEWPFRPRVALP